MKKLEGTLSSVVIHVVRLRHAGEQYKTRNGRRQTKEITILNDMSSLLVFTISASPALSVYHVTYYVQITYCLRYNALQLTILRLCLIDWVNVVPNCSFKLFKETNLDPNLSCATSQ